MVTTNLFASAWSAAWLVFPLAVILGSEKRSWFSSSRSAPATLTSTVELIRPPGGKTELRRAAGSCANSDPTPAVSNAQQLHHRNPRRVEVIARQGEDGPPAFAQETSSA